VLLAWWDILQVIIRRPSVLYHQFRIVSQNGKFRRKRVRWLSHLTGAPEADVQRYIDEVEGDKEFIQDLRKAYLRYTTYLPSPSDFMVEPIGGGSKFFHFVSQYALVRVERPRIVVETGGTPGKSSAFILCAMERNRKGELYTIDLPPTKSDAAIIGLGQSHHVLPYGVGANWCVPQQLRGRHHLILGPAQEHLPFLLRRLEQIDIFIHDSEHSYAHMQWEFRTAFPRIRPGGYLWSDDIRANTAWHDFCEERHLDHSDFLSQGVVRKDWVGDAKHDATRQEPRQHTHRSSRS
jgi:hypothetical protein